MNNSDEQQRLMPTRGRGRGRRWLTPARADKADSGDRARIQVNRRAFDGLPRFVDEHHRDAVADRIGELVGIADQLLRGTVVAERALADWADENFKQASVHELSPRLMR